MKKALITGVSGQDGSYLAELLLEQGYDVHGVVQEAEVKNPQQRLFRLRTVLDRIILHSAELNDLSAISSLIEQVQPNECYHLAAQSFVSYTQESEFTTISTNIYGTHNILAALKIHAPECKLYFAGSSEMFGNVQASPQDETTPINPRSVYGVTKATGYFLSKTYRDIHNLFTCNGILYNHESERRGLEFVTRKITSGAAKVKLGLAPFITLGNIEARRDWGYAPDYVKAMWMMLQQNNADDYVVGTGVTHSVKELLQIAFGTLDLDWEKYVKIDSQLFKLAETVELRANSTKILTKLGWKPTVEFEEMIQRMVRFDLDCFQETNPLSEKGSF